jgi:hypothetical protein
LKEHFQKRSGLGRGVGCQHGISGQVNGGSRHVHQRFYSPK